MAWLSKFITRIRPAGTRSLSSEERSPTAASHSNALPGATARQDVSAGRDAIVAGRDVFINGHPPRQRYRRPLMAWGLFIAALAGIAISLVFQHGMTASSGALSPGNGQVTLPGGPGQKTSQARVAITSWEEQPLTTGGVRYTFHGTITGQAQEIYVILQDGPPLTTSSAAARPWSVSPPARLSGGRWIVIWDLPRQPADARWAAVAMADIPCGGSGIECSPAPDRPASAIASSTVLPAPSPQAISSPAAPCPTGGFATPYPYSCGTVSGVPLASVPLPLDVACKWAYPGRASGQVSGSEYSIACLDNNGQLLGGFNGAHSLNAWCADSRHTDRKVLPDPQLLDGKWACTGPP